MSKLKRNLQLGAAVLSIVFGSILAISGVYLLMMLISLNAAVSATEQAAMMLVMVSPVLVILFAVALIIVCALMCPNPDKKAVPTTYKGLTIAGLVLNAILFLLYIINLSFYAIIPAIGVGLFIAALCVKDTPATPAMPEVPVAPVAPVEEPASEAKAEVKQEQKSE